MALLAVALIGLLTPDEVREGGFLGAPSSRYFLFALGWSLLIGLVELLPVPAWRGLTISVGFPLLMAVALLYPPGTAGFIAFLGASDSRELKRQVKPDTAIFNRSQVALSVLAASAVFHSLANLKPASPALVLVLAASLAAIADYAVNASLVAAYMSVKLHTSAAQMFRRLTIGNARDFLISYLGLGVLGLSLAVLVVDVSPWTIPAFLAPALLARQVFFRSQALEEAHKELQEREEILRVLSNTMAEERTDERLQIASYLHDDLAQVLFRLSLQVDIARKLLDKGDIAELQSQLDKIRESKQDTSDRIRALIRDLHRSPLGAKGLARSARVLHRRGRARLRRPLSPATSQNIDLPAPITLLIFHIAREGVMNSLKHAKATDMFISVRAGRRHRAHAEGQRASGFDTTAPGPEGHYGMAMMRERAQVGGGSFEVESALGEGTTITVRFPTDLLQPDQTPGTEQASANGQAHASPDTTGTTSRSDEGSRDSVRA